MRLKAEATAKYSGYALSGSCIHWGLEIQLYYVDTLAWFHDESKFALCLSLVDRDDQFTCMRDPVSVVAPGDASSATKISIANH